MKFEVGQKVYKPNGYSYPGIIVAAFKNTKGLDRYVVESTSEGTEGMLHIFNDSQLEVSE